MVNRLVVFLSVMLMAGASNAQIVDKIDGIVDRNIILRSDIESQVELIKSQGASDDKLFCDVFDQMLMGKLLVAQAILDSVTVAPEEVDAELDRKVDYYIQMIGSREAFEEYYGKTVAQIKDDFRADIKDQMLATRMRGQVVSEIDVTPSEVRNYFDEIPKDSLPFFNTEFELSQIVVTAKVSEEMRMVAKQKAEDIRARIMEGESFDVFCNLYTEDEASKSTNCELGFVPRGTFVPEFEAAAWNLSEGEVSEVVETQYGFHIIMLVGRRGEMINVRHILIKAQTTTADLLLAKLQLDTLRTNILSDSISFFDAVKEYSEDKYSKDNGGVIINPQNGLTILQADEIQPQTDFFIIDTMKEGQITAPLQYRTFDGKDAYRLVKVDSKTPPHIANLKDDWDKIYEVAKSNKQNEVLERWIKQKARKTYIMIDDRYKSCQNITSWLNQ